LQCVQRPVIPVLFIIVEQSQAACIAHSSYEPKLQALVGGGTTAEVRHIVAFFAFSDRGRMTCNLRKDSLLTRETICLLAGMNRRCVSVILSRWLYSTTHRFGGHLGHPPRTCDLTVVPFPPCHMHKSAIKQRIPVRQVDSRRSTRGRGCNTSAKLQKIYIPIPTNT
jgi:hypothetical protein